MPLNISALAPAIGNTRDLMSRFNSGPRVDVSAKLREFQNERSSQMPSTTPERTTSGASSSGSGESGAIIDTTDTERRNAVTTAQMNDMNNDPTLNNSAKVQLLHENLDLAVQSVANNEQRLLNLINRTG